MKFQNLKSLEYPGHILIGPYSTSKIEIWDILKSWVAISLAFGILQGEVGLTIQFLSVMIFSAITVGSAFIIHELSHKITAQHYGCFAEYRSNNFMLLLAILMSFSGFLFFAPGAVLISGPVGKKRNGIISAAGPASNFALGIIFLMLYSIAQPEGILFQLASYGVSINAWIGLFNLLPFFIFDGKKIWQWDWRIWAGMVIIGLGLLFSKGIIRTS